MTSLRDLPSVDQILQTPAAIHWAAEFGRPLVTEAVRHALAEARAGFPETGQVPNLETLTLEIERLLGQWTIPTLLPVINATGVVLHTNLGRAPLSQAALRAARQAGEGYTNLEFDLPTGKRGSRLVHAEAVLQRLSGAEAAVVVNNNAAAVLLALSALASRRAVVIARTQLVEIGGGFRVPDVMKQSGARLVEVGATNRVHLSDYEAALEHKPALLLHAHRSNFRLMGFTSEPGLDEIAGLAHHHGLPLVDDLGSGALLDTTRFGLAHEPTVQESLAAGADLVCFSGDKLLGGPQAGIIIGRADLVARIKKHPLARAVRADKLGLAALTATLVHYLKDEAEREIPIWRMISQVEEVLCEQARAWAQSLASDGIQCEVIQGVSTVGGGSLPGETLPTHLLALDAPRPDRLLARLRRNEPPVIARTVDDRAAFDPRTVLPEQEDLLLDAIKRNI